MRRGKTHPGRHTKETSGSGALVALGCVLAGLCPMPNKGFKVAVQSSMTGQLAAQRVHVLWEKYWLAAWQDE